MNIMKYWRWLETGNWIHNTWSELQPITVFRSSVSGLRGPLLNRYWSKLILLCGCVKMFTNEHFLTRLQTIRRHFATSGHPLQTAALRHFSGTTVHYFIQSLFTAENLCCFCVTTCRLRWFYKQNKTEEEILQISKKWAEAPFVCKPAVRRFSGDLYFLVVFSGDLICHLNVTETKTPPQSELSINITTPSKLRQGGIWHVTAAYALLEQRHAELLMQKHIYTQKNVLKNVISQQ